MTVFEFVFIGVLVILACVLFSLFGFTVATRAAMMIGMGLAGLLLIAVATLKIEECPVANNWHVLMCEVSGRSSN